MRMHLQFCMKDAFGDTTDPRPHSVIAFESKKQKVKTIAIGIYTTPTRKLTTTKTTSYEVDTSFNAYCV